MDYSTPRLVYSRNLLHSLRAKSHIGVVPCLPVEVRKPYRGCRAGALLKARRLAKKWRFKPPVPSIIMGNVNSLPNKIDELAALTRNVKTFRECSLLCFTETWLTASIPDANVELPDFSAVRADRDTRACGKRKGGGLTLYVNKRWCNPGHVNIKISTCCRDIELLVVSLRPYYLPREFSHAIVLIVYIPPRADAETACDVIHSAVARVQTQHPEALVLISGDSNHVTLDNTLAAFHQYVDCNTRGKRTLDLMYANVKDAYGVSPLPALGKADHNLVLLKPHYSPKVRKLPTTTRSFRKWSPEAEQALKDCFEITDWETLQESHSGDMEEMVDCTTDYINFCMDNVVPVRTVRCFANNKPWITSDIKGLLNQKKKAFKEGNTQELKQIQRELRVQLREAKEQYRRKIEQRMQTNNMREVWEGMKIITGCSTKRGPPTEGDVGRANQLNNFFNRFDQPHPFTPLHTAAPTLPQDIPNTEDDTSPPPITPTTITAAQVCGALKRLRPNKAAGPDGVSPRLLKACAKELGHPLQRIFNLSLGEGRVPQLWKTSCIIPVPKKPHPGELNDFRPVALTSHVMKTMERLLFHHLRPQTHHALDPLQFAFREKTGVEDAIIFLLHRSLSHLDRGSGAVRITFLDFSSAFNTIQPLLLRDKLTEMGVETHLVAWITDYLTNRPQYVRLGDSRSDTVASSTGAPQGTVLSPVLFTLYTSDFQSNTEFCHVQKFADDTAIVGCIRNGQEDEYRKLIQDFVAWSDSNHLLLNTTKTREMVVDFRRPRPLPEPVSIKGDCVEVVHTYKYLGVQLDDKLDWTANTEALCRKGQSRMYFLRRLASFNICKKLLQIFYQSVVASALMYAVVCWGSSLKKKDAARLDKLVRKAGSVVGTELDILTSVAERRTLNRLLSIIDNPDHPLHSTITRQRSSFSDRLLSLSCSTDRLKRSFLPHAIRLFNTSRGGR